VRIAAHDRAGLERLLRYCARPPFALHRLRPASSRVRLESPDARLIYELPCPAHDGRTAVRVGPLELLDRLARLIPPPRVHRHRYHGVFGPNATWRREATRSGREYTADEADTKPSPPCLGRCLYARGRSRPPTQVGSAPRPRSALALGHRARSTIRARPVRSEPPPRRRHLERLNRPDPGARPLPVDHPPIRSSPGRTRSSNTDRPRHTRSCLIRTIPRLACAVPNRLATLPAQTAPPRLDFLSALGSGPSFSSVWVEGHRGPLPSFRTVRVRSRQNAKSDSAAEHRPIHQV
jgi:hypothetical protein